MYVLDGNPKDVENVIKEQRIRIQRGVVKITPLEEAGLVKEDEDAGRQVADLMEENAGLRSEIDGMCKENAVLRSEVDESRNKIADLEKEVQYLKDHYPTMPADSKDAPEADSKTMSEADVKDAPEAEQKGKAAEDSKKTKKGK